MVLPKRKKNICCAALPLIRKPSYRCVSTNLGDLLTNAKKVTVSVLYWYEKLSSLLTEIFKLIPKGIKPFMSFFSFSFAVGQVKEVHFTKFNKIDKTLPGIPPQPRKRYVPTNAAAPPLGTSILS